MKKSQATESNCYSWYDTSPPLPYIVALPDFIKKQETYPLATHDRHDQVRGLRYVRLPNRGMGYSFLFKRLAAIPKIVRWEPAPSALSRTDRGSHRLNLLGHTSQPLWRGIEGSANILDTSAMLSSASESSMLTPLLACAHL